MAHVFCLDASACALLSEDYPGTTRFHFQRELVACQTRACLAVLPAGAATAATAANLRPQHLRTIQQEQQQLVLVTSSNGKAAVALHPTSETAALQQALAGVQPGGEANLEAALKLALLVTRRFGSGSTRVTAFVASPGAAATLVGATGSTSDDGAHSAAAELRQRYQQATVSLDVAVLCSRQEMGAAATAALEVLTGTSSPGPNISPISSNDGERDAPAADAAPPGCSRVLWLSPVESAAESWQQLEPALEQLEGSSSSSTDAANSRVRQRGGLPARISRAPRQFDPLRHPRAPLLAMRSGVQQPAMCRGESLNRLGHLSSDGMMRPWLPTYSSIAQQAAAAGAQSSSDSGRAGAGAGAGAAQGAGSGSGKEMVYIEVQPVPKYRTLIKVAAGRMLPQPSSPLDASPHSEFSSGAVGDSPRSPGSAEGGYAAASSKLLRSLQALRVLDEGEEEAASSGTHTDSSSRGSGDGSTSCGSPSTPAAAAALAAAAPTRYQPDRRRGTLRLLQACKEPRLLKLVWTAHPDESSTAAAEGDATSQQQPLDMFGGSTAATASGRSHSSNSTAQALLGIMPASAVAESAARGPLLREGCELWEAAVEHDWELELPTGWSPSSGGSSGAPVQIKSRQLPNGAQVLLVHADSDSGISGSRRWRSFGSQQRQQAPSKAAAFWLQQAVSADALQPPAYATAASATPEDTEEPQSYHAATGQQDHDVQQQEQQKQAAGPAQAAEQQAEGQGPAALLAAALQRLLERPPEVDLRRLRRDVKSGAIQVTPVTVGPLPAAFVRDIVGARSAMMSTLGMENLDSWDAPGSSAPTSAAPAGRNSGKATAVDGAKGHTAGSQSAAGRAALAGAAMREHRAAALSLLRQRLGRQQPGSNSSGGTAPTQEQAPAAAPPPQEDDAPTADAAAAAAAAAPSPAAGAIPAAAIPCTPPPHVQHADATAAGSYGDSGAATPFGTPLNILPSSLLQRRLQQHSAVHAGDGVGSVAAEAGAGADGQDAMAETAAEADHPALADAGPAGLPKQEGSVVLVGAGTQGEAGSSDGPLFQLE